MSGPAHTIYQHEPEETMHTHGKLIVIACVAVVTLALGMLILTSTASARTDAPSPNERPPLGPVVQIGPDGQPVKDAHGNFVMVDPGVTNLFEQGPMVKRRGKLVRQRDKWGRPAFDANGQPVYIEVIESGP